MLALDGPIFVLTIAVVILLASHVWSVGVYTASDNVLYGRVSGYARLSFSKSFY